MDTPMAVDTRARARNRSRAEVAAERDAKVPLRGRIGTAWDVANSALFLARLSAPLGRQSRRDLRPRLTLHGSPAALAATSDELALPEGPAARLRTVDA